MRILSALLLTLALPMLLSACGLRPVYSNGGRGAAAQSLAAVQVEPVEGKAGWLLGNAIKFTENGEISICFSKVNDSQWKVAVRDTGIGITKDAQQFIFEPFRQADESMTRKYGGMGLGLSVARELSILMRGSIQVESEVGKGSLFTVTLPL